MVVDFEFEFGGHATLEDAGRSGERPRPVCMVAKDLRSGQTWERFRGEFGPQPPFPTGPDSVLIAYYASAELGCFRALGWQFPTFVLDLFTEFRASPMGAIPPRCLVIRCPYLFRWTVSTPRKGIFVRGYWPVALGRGLRSFLKYCGSDVRRWNVCCLSC
jgi:hypothetical protein